MLGHRVHCRFCYHRRVRRSVVFPSLLGLLACSSSARVDDLEWTPASPPDLGSVVARVGDVPIFGKQVEAAAKRTGVPLREALDALVDFNLLAERARRERWRPAKSSDEEVESILVQRFLERELEPKLRPDAVPDSVLRPLYERAKDHFVHPRLVEIGVLAVYTGARMKDEPRQERTKTAQELATYVKSHPHLSLDEFAAVAQDPAWSSRGVVATRFLQGLDKPLSKVVGQAVAKLHSPGETTGLLTDEDGFFIARYIGERPPQNTSFEEIRPKLLAGVLDRYQQREFIVFTDKLLQRHKVEAFYDRLSPDEQGP